MDERNQKIDEISNAIDQFWPPCVKNRDERFGVVTSQSGQLELYVRGNYDPAAPIEFLKSKKYRDKVFANRYSLVDAGWSLD